MMTSKELKKEIMSKLNLKTTEISVKYIESICNR